MNQNKKGYFIVFEGIDGSGKSTQVINLQNTLINRKYDVLSTREPSKNSPIGALINSILYNGDNVPDESLALLFAADRVVHTEKIIIPALINGKIVISDRYVHSSLAYQSMGMKKPIDTSWIQNINRNAIDPDMIVFLDIAPEIAIHRLNNGQKRVLDHNFFEKIETQKRIREGYFKVLKLAELSDKENFSIIKNEKTSILQINANLRQDNIKEIIIKVVLDHIKNKEINKKEKNGYKGESLKLFFSEKKKPNEKIIINNNS